MDFHVTVRADKKEQLAKVIELIASGNEVHRDGKFVFKSQGYRVIDGKLFISKYSDKATPFAYEFNVEQLIDFVWGWIEANKKPNYNEPDTDGHCREAFEITTKGCGIGSSDWGMLFSIKAIWFVFGK